jgi:colanic acid/amylovoran biosynthesis glycosyltransferase
MGEAFAVVVPSIVGKDGDKEGLPSVVVEALAIACSVVVSDAAGVAGLDGFETAGAVTPAGDQVALADALAGLVGDPVKRAKCEAGALALAQRSFNAQAQSRRLEDRLLNVIARTPSH